MDPKCCAELDFKWAPVLSDRLSRYMFPSNVSPEMKAKYYSPAVYRWNVFEGEVEKKLAYIGETNNLIKRIEGCRHPCPNHETNKRLRTEFKRMRDAGMSIYLDFLIFNDLKTSGAFSRESLNDGNFRRSLEERMKAVHIKEGYTLLNR